jgi:glycerophosphoryl diester phosphodiesterase
MKVVAHRGHSQTWGDNTLIAFQKAIECGTFDAIEMDIQLDNCNEIIIKHDLLLKEDGEKLYLKDFFEKVNVPPHMKIFFDIKGSSDIVPHLENFFRDSVLDQYVFCSFNIKTLKKFRLPVTQGFITANVLRECDLKPVLDNRIKYILLDWTFLDKEMIDYCWSIGLMVYTYTPNNQLEVSHAIKYNIDGIIINNEIHNI